MSETGEMQADLFRVGLANLKRNWAWYMALGALLLILGSIAIGASLAATLLAVEFLGWLMVFAGGAEAIHAFWRKDWGGFFVDLLGGVLYLVVGVLLVVNPQAGAEALTLMIAAFLSVSGAFRVVAALAGRPPHWGWLLVNGVLGVLLGGLIWGQWPLSGTWVIGLFVGIEMIFNGWSLVMLALAARNLPVEGFGEAPPVSS
jgi:uncharacterized membrane protein HdeD (DUF308 family)